MLALAADLAGDVVVPEVDRGWARSLVDLGPGTHVFKVWFDNCTGGSGRRRGFTVCGPHSCIKYHQIYGTPKEFFVAMALWQQRGLDDITMDHAGHLAYWPTNNEVQASLPSLRLRPF